MTEEPTTDGRRERVSPGGVAAAVLGVALFVWVVGQAGLGEVATGFRRLGWLFLVVVALGGLRFAARGMAWRGCLEGAHRLTPGRAFQGVAVGDALGNLTPLSLLVSEPAKALYVRDREPVSRTLAALAVENLFYSLSAAFVIAGGALALALRLRATGTWWLASVALVTALVVGILAAHAMFWRRVRVVGALCDLVERRRRTPPFVARWAARARRVEDRLHALYPRAPGRLLRLAGWEVSFHALAILEIYLVLSLISDVTPTLLEAFVFESTNRFITTVFKVVPLRIGVDEAGTAAFAELLAFGAAAGVTLAIVRKARMLVWTAAGVGLLVRQGLSVRRAIAAAETARAAAGRLPSSGGTVRGAAVAVMARSPDGARPPKTRLAGVLPDEAGRRRLSAAFLADVVAACGRIDGVTVRVAYTEDGGTGGFAQAGVAADQLVPQRGAGLGERERSVFEDLFRDGFSPVVLIGSDLPTLPAARVGEAFDRLRGGPDTVVLGPADDGGYYLIGLAARPGPVPDLFTGIRWGTGSAQADTVAAAARCGLAVELLDAWYDVDDEAGLTRLRAELAIGDGARRAPATARVLAEILGGPGPTPRGGLPSP